MTKKISEFLTKSEALRLAWKSRKDYIGVDTKSSLYTSWRARLFTAKGRIDGFPETWHTFKGFKEEMSEGWEEGLILVRKNPKIPFSKENCEWIEKGTENIGKLIQFEYKGKTQTLLEWANEFDLNYNGVRQRYFKGKNYTKEQILFGKNYKAKGDIHDHKELEYQKRRNKISRMLSAYRHRDRVRNFEHNLTKEFFENTIISQPCIYCGSTKNVGCDRIDNSKGHTVDNVVPACYICNTTRNDLFTFEEMKILGKTIQEIHKKRK